MALVLRIPPRAMIVLQIVAVTIAYYLAAEIGLLFAVVRDQVTPFWPPTGIALAALLLWGLRTWPGIALGALLVNLPIGPSVVTVGAIAVGNTMAPVLVYLLLTRTDFHPRLDRLSDAVRLVFFGALGGSLVSASIGSLALAQSGAVPTSEFLATWSVWWTGDAMGLLLVAPLLLTYATSRWRTALTPGQWLEAAAVLLCTVAVSVATARGLLPMMIYAFPLLVWAAVRFRHLGATPAALIVSTGAMVAAQRGVDPFQGLDTFATMVTLQTFNSTVALTCLLLAAVIAERDQAYRTIQNAVSQVSAALAQSSGRPPLDASVWRLPEQTDTGAAPPSVSRPAPPPE
ncbi:MAG: MASE1 domain-containing protein [Micromonosporaceae bacterium]